MLSRNEEKHMVQVLQIEKRTCSYFKALNDDFKYNAVEIRAYSWVSINKQTLLTDQILPIILNPLTGYPVNFYKTPIISAVEPYTEWVACRAVQYEAISSY